MADRSFSIDLTGRRILAIDGGKVLLTLLEKSGQRAKLAFVAGDDVTVVKGRKALAGAEQAKKGLTP